MKRSIELAAIAAVLGFAVSCASEPDPAEPDAGTPADAGTDAGATPPPFETWAQFDDARSEAICDLAVRCGVFASAEACVAANYPADETSMVLLPNRMGDVQRSAVEAALADQRATFDGDAARRCVDAIGEAQCADWFESFANSDCASALTGTVAAGGDCYGHFECVPSAYCDSTSGQCPRECVERKALGQEGGDDISCQDGLYSYNGICEQKVAIGQDCTSPQGGLGVDLRCADGAYCDENKICRARGAAGATCAGDGACLAPLVCLDGTCSARGALGAACLHFQESCRLDEQCNALTWDGEGVCAARGTDGQGCIDSIQCATGFACRGVTETPGQCAAFKAIGADCDPFAWPPDCVEEAYCDTGTNRCVAHVAIGQACSQPDACGLDAFCNDTGTCVRAICADPSP